MRADIEMTNGTVYEAVTLVTPAGDFSPGFITNIQGHTWIEVSNDDGSGWLQVSNISGIAPRTTL